MQKIGFIGYGSMGSILIRSLITSGSLKQNEIIIATRTQGKLYSIKKILSGH